jgi:alginate export protein
MNPPSLRKSQTLAAILLLAIGSLHGQTSNPSVAGSAVGTATPNASAGPSNDWLRQQNSLFDPFDLGGQVGARYVYQTYFAVPGGGATAVDFRANTPHSENDFLLVRARVHMGYSPADWLMVYGEGQNSSSTGDKRDPNPQADTPFDLRQGYLRLGGATDFPLSLKVGRQELAYGDERLVGVFDWDNLTRVFDAARLRYEAKDFWVDAFISRVVIADDDHFNQANWDDSFSGLYASTRSLVPNTELQLYFLSDNASANSPKASGTGGKGNSPRDIYTVGMRFQTLPGQLQGWDFNGEFAGQFGDFEYPAGTPGVINGKRLDHLAYATHLEGGYTFSNLDLRPRLTLGIDYGSGDDNPKDQEHSTFVNLYPTNHKFYGAMDFFSWQNMIDPYLKATLVPVRGLTVVLTYNAFWLASTSDFFYQINQSARTKGGYGIQPQNGNFAGQEIDLVVSYQPKPFMQIQGGYGHYFTGSYIDDTFRTLGGSHDADWVYLQAQFSL